MKLNCIDKLKCLDKGHGKAFTCSLASLYPRPLWCYPSAIALSHHSKGSLRFMWFWEIASIMAFSDVSCFGSEVVFWSNLQTGSRNLLWFTIREESDWSKSANNDMIIKNRLQVLSLYHDMNASVVANSAIGFDCSAQLS